MCQHASVRSPARVACRLRARENDVTCRPGWQGTVSENPEESTSSESEPLLRESKGEQPDGVQTHQKPSKHKTKAIKGEWQFKMYTDVLHAQSSFARDELVAVARAEMQEGRREAAASRRQERLQARESRAARGQREAPPGWWSQPAQRAQRAQGAQGSALGAPWRGCRRRFGGRACRAPLRRQ